MLEPVTMMLRMLSPVSIQTQSLVLRALRKRKPQETQVLALASMVATALTEHSYWLVLAFVAWKFAVFVYATQAIAFEWKPGFNSCCTIVQLWTLETGKLVCTLDKHTAPINAVQFHPSELLMASGSSDKYADHQLSFSAFTRKFLVQCYVAQFQSSLQTLPVIFNGQVMM